MNWNLLNFNKIYLFIVFIFCGAIKFSVAQVNNPVFDTKKYWYYKTRLNNDFMKVGINPGESLPIPERSFGGPNTPNIKMGDEPAFVGIYLGVLATEYHLLKTNNQNTDDVRYELYCALTALNRCDIEAERVFSNQGFGLAIPNGFCIKDDFSKSKLIQDYKHFNYYNSSTDQNGNLINLYGGFVTNPNDLAQIPINASADRGFCTPGAIWRVPEDGLAGGTTYSSLQYDTWPFDYDNQTRTILNQDAYIALLMGLTLVDKYVDDGANWNNSYFNYVGSNTTSIRQESRNINSRIIDYFRRNNWALVNESIYDNAQPVPLGNFAGGSAWFLSYAIGEAACTANGTNDNWSQGDIFIPGVSNGDPRPHNCSYSNGLVPDVLSFPFWKGYHKTVGLTMDNAGFLADLNATCKCGWGGAASEVQSTVCNVVSTVFCAVFGWFGWDNCQTQVSTACNTLTSWLPVYQNRTYTDMLDNVEEWELYHAPLLYEALGESPHPFFQNPIKSHVENMLDLAPCEGPHNFGPQGRTEYEWSTDSRIEHPNRRQQHNNPTMPDFPAYYNGLDYMLYFNLLKITSPNSINVPFVNLSNRYVHNSLPDPSFPYSCGSNNTCKIGAFEFITADNSIATTGANAEIEYRAGKQVDLKPGFTVSANSNFHAYVDPFRCDIRAEDYNRVIANSNNPNSSLEYDDLGIYSTYDVYPENNSVKQNDIKIESNIQIVKNQDDNQSSLFFKNMIIDVYPNPNDGNFTININLNKGDEVKMTIIDQLGRKVKEEKLKVEGSIINKILELSNQGKGLYFINFTNTIGNTINKTILIQ